MRWSPTWECRAGVAWRRGPQGAIAPGVPAVVVTGWADEEDIARTRGREVDAVLVKPVDPDDLVEAVAEVPQARPDDPD
jgi:CheY-like chemotaxis protein